ncbi:hypothetical protein CCHL11_08715 [Colletotrichum chlorophyti]|uniref:Uncharacterized protein n=1 Tax=Colletotrichum chlorophyti TaxID=708187 RepID=A0A1Q8RHD1_9PEZI|nr:hypothetical protein CCHL11_08715 [Colletotrichum chlorophyti]
MSESNLPTVSIQASDNFRFGPSIVNHDAQRVLASSNGTTNGSSNGVHANGTNGTNGNSVPATSKSTAAKLTSLDILSKFTGKFQGHGFNTIFRPDGSSTPTDLKIQTTDGVTDNILQLNLTSETQEFLPQKLDDVPNRGLFKQGDISLRGFMYTQTIQDAMDDKNPTGETPPKDSKNPEIHFETGLWMRVPANQKPKLNASFVRMASIPHGTTINAQGFDDAKTSNGAPVFPEADITPSLVKGGSKIPFKSQTLADTKTHRLPQDLSAYNKAGTITQEIINNPNLVLSIANKGKQIIENTTFTVSTKPKATDFGGGTSNIGFLVGDGSQGDFEPDTTPNRANANVVTVSAQYWVSKVRTKLDLKPSPPKATVSPKRLRPNDTVPSFIVNFEVKSPRTVTVEYTQIQYSQLVVLDFATLSWPHVTVGTLAPVDLEITEADLIQ